MPRIGVGVPTYNRSSYLRETLACLREQQDADFTVLVMDNASTDNTHEVFVEMVGNDRRFAYQRQPVNRPAAQNFRDVLNAMETPYFLWRADDDLSAANYLAALSAGLDEDDQAELAVSPLYRLLGESRSEVPLQPMPDGSAVDRAIFLLRNCRPTWIYGMWRREAILSNFARSEGRYDYLWASDHAWMLPTVLNGRVAVRQDTWFLQRIVGEGSYRLAPDEQLKARSQYAAYARSIVDTLQIPTARQPEFDAALEYHIEQRVGPLWRLRRRKLKQRLKQVVGIGRKS